MLTPEQKILLAEAAHKKVLELPNYNPKINGFRVYKKHYLEFIITSPQNGPAACYLQDLEKIISKLFKSEGLKITQSISYISHDYRVKNWKRHYRKNLHFLIRKIEFI